MAQSYAQGALVVNPVRMGTGLNIKTMECLALGVPLVVTESGSRGLENLRGRAFLAVADDDAAAMAAGVVRGGSGAARNASARDAGCSAGLELGAT